MVAGSARKQQGGSDLTGRLERLVPLSLWMEYPQVYESDYLKLMVGYLGYHHKAKTGPGLAQGLGWFLCHAYSQKDLYEGTGIQEHYNSDCPCPVDLAVVAFLRKWEVPHYYAFDKDTGDLYRATVAALVVSADRPDEVERFQKRTVRTRVLLPRNCWDHRPGFKQIGEGAKRMIINERAEPMLLLPYIPATYTLPHDTGEVF